MHGTLPARVIEAREIERRIMRGAAKFCGEPVFSRVIKAIWGEFKTASELRNILGCSQRTAEYMLSGEHVPSGRAMAEIQWAVQFNTTEVKLPRE